MLKFEDLIEGEIYAAIDVNSKVYILRKRGLCNGRKIEDSCNYLSITGNYYSKIGNTGNLNTNNNSSFLAYRQCTFQERKFFEACEKANMFLNWEDFKNLVETTDNYLTL